MVSQHGIKLAVHLISSYFGEIVAKVCECLLREGTLPLAQIIRYTELSAVNAKNALLVLIQHNCVQAFAIRQEGGFGAMPKVITHYMVLFDNIIHHMRFPKFMKIVSEELDSKEEGSRCVDILEGLLQHGRLSMNQIIDRHKQTSNQKGGYGTVDALQETFCKLVHARYVERCPAPEPFLAPMDEEEDSAAKKRPKSAKKAQTVETLEQRALVAAAPMKSIRFLVETDSIDDSEEMKEDDLTSSKVGDKRKRSSLESNWDALDIDGSKEVLWRANFEQFIRCLRHKACIENVRSRLDDGAGIVLNAILKATGNAETKLKMENSVPLSMNSILEELFKSDEGRSMTTTRVEASLEQLGCNVSAIEIDATYSVDLKSIIEQAQDDEVESRVLKRYGTEAYRIFRLLSKTGRPMETDKISDTAFVEKKDAAKILFELQEDDYLHMERIGITGRQPLFLLWKVNKQPMKEHVLDEMYHAALNLKLRTAHEREQEKEFLHIPTGDVGKELRERSIRYRKKRIFLDSSLMKLDDAIMLFHDF